MIPGNSLSSIVLSSAYLPGDDIIGTDLIDNELGGIALNDPSQGLTVQVWTLSLVADNIVVTSPATGSSIVLNAPGTTQLSLAFDQNMNIAVAYVQAGLAKFYWYDTVISGYVTTTYPGATIIRCGLDDKRPTQRNSSDIILAYVRSGALYFRQQRERFNTEYLLSATVPGKFSRMGMNTVNRLQFQFDEVV